MDYSQESYRIRCEWGERGVEVLGPICDAIVIVDILSFSTCVDVALWQGAEVYPCLWKDTRGEEFAQSIGGVLAGKRETDKFSLSPASLLQLPEKTRLVLPSPNGSTLTTLAAEQTDLVFTSCLRNAEAVARQLQDHGGTIGVIPAGERWPDGSLRPALEDWIGAGALLSHLKGDRSPEAEAAAQSFEAARSDIHTIILNSSSGRELSERGFAKDVQIAAELNVSDNVPMLSEGRYTKTGL